MKDLDCGADFPASYCFEEYRLKKYELGSNDYDQLQIMLTYKTTICSTDSYGHLLILEYVPVGGRTRFPTNKPWVQPMERRIAVFPANWMFRHSGMPTLEVTSTFWGLTSTTYEHRSYYSQ